MIDRRFIGQVMPTFSVDVEKGRLKFFAKASGQTCLPAGNNVLITPEARGLADQLGITLDAVVVPCGGGGLSSGIALAIKSRSPRTEVWVAEPENFDDTRRSLEVQR